MKRQIILAILDGWGIGAKNNSNPIYIGGTPNIDYIKSHFPGGSLQASGIAVGLPWNEEGNSEVGHLTIGAGKVIYQHYPRISIAIRDGSFFKNKAFLEAVNHVQKNKSALHFAGLLTEANIHASLEHLIGLIKLADQNKLNKTFLHLYTDGKDSPLKSSLGLLKKVEPLLNDKIKIASIIGRYYSLNRDKRWELTKQAYEALTGSAPLADNAEKIISETHNSGLSDEYVEPRLIGPETNGIKDNDAVIFFDFREDSVRQIVESFVNPEFKEFPVKKFNNLYIATMTNYSDKFQVPVAFPPEKVEHPLGKILADNGKSQLRIAETEKYAHVTYFFNGLNDKVYPNELRILIPSKITTSHAEHPEMMAAEITSRVLQVLDDEAFDFILVNYANGDLIAHTGNFDAALKAVKTIDEEVGKLTKKILGGSGEDILLITSDHGNIEKMMDPLTAEPTTGHDTSPVPIYLIAKNFQRNKTKQEAEESKKETTGILSDIAPTILELMGIPKPKEMTGQSLLGLLE